MPFNITPSEISAHVICMIVFILSSLNQICSFTVASLYLKMLRKFGSLDAVVILLAIVLSYISDVFVFSN